MNVDEAYAFCRAVAHKYGANFSVGFRFLPRQKRRAVYAAYAFCRWADDIADEGPSPGASRHPLPASRGEGLRSPSPRLRGEGARRADEGFDEACTNLDGWQCELDRCYDNAPSHPVTIALADSLKHFAIPKSAFVALIDGCRQDLVKNRYDNFDELLDYCRMVALSIADISLAIFGYTSPAAIEHGRSLATALQLTNVTRDIGDDLARDRVYIPQDELCRFGVTRFDPTPEMRRLIEFQIDRAESYFRAAEPLIRELSFDARFPVLLMGGIYANVLKRLRRDPLIVLRERLSLSKFQKSAVVVARLLRPRFVS